MVKTVIVRYGELALKSEPIRRRFERCLVSAINLALKGLKYRIGRERGRIFVNTNSPAAVTKRLSKLPGIVSVSSAAKVTANIDEIRPAAVRVAKKVLGPGMRFAVRSSKVGNHPFSSRDVNVEVGSAILSKVKGVRVDLSHPDREIFVEIREKDAYVFTEMVEGIGGLPMGTQGRVVALFSGGRGDVAAAYLMMKRGCELFPVFPDPRPHGDGKVLRLIIASAKRLADLDPKLELRVFPFGEVLGALKKAVEGAPAYFICRRSALRAAEAIAGRIGAEAVVVGDDAKQLAALKLANLRVVDDACKLPVLRSLAGVSSTEIKQLKIKIKAPLLTKEIYHFSPPTEPVNLGEVRELEESMGIGALIRESLSKLKTIKLR